MPPDQQSDPKQRRAEHHASPRFGPRHAVSIVGGRAIRPGNSGIRTRERIAKTGGARRRASQGQESQSCQEPSDPSYLHDVCWNWGTERRGTGARCTCGAIYSRCKFRKLDQNSQADIGPYPSLTIQYYPRAISRDLAGELFTRHPEILQIPKDGERNLLGIEECLCDPLDVGSGHGLNAFH